MAKPVQVDPEADEEITHARRWIDTEAGRGAALLDEVEATIGRIAAAPQASTPVLTHEEITVRPQGLKGFRYAIVFYETPEYIQVVAFAHGSRRPFYWADRL